MITFDLVNVLTFDDSDTVACHSVHQGAKIEICKTFLLCGNELLF